MTRIPKYKVGDIIQIREWNDMTKRYGFRNPSNIDASSIDVPFAFTKFMKRLCNRRAKIKRVAFSDLFEAYDYQLSFIDVEGSNDYSFSEEMFVSPTSLNKLRLKKEFNNDLI